MGSGTFDPGDWKAFTHKSTSGRHRKEIFSSSSCKKEFDPKNITLRESCNSTEHPDSTPIIIALDVTGSMGNIPDNLVRDGLNRLVTDILERKPVNDPQIMFMAIGDSYYDSYPLQATQFESDIRIAEQLKDLYLEGGGGGNVEESYHLAWYFASRKTKLGCTNQNKKGILFTIGDEQVPEQLVKEHVSNVFNDTIQADIDTTELLRMVEERYDVYHLVIKEGHNYKISPDSVDKCWKNILGQRVIPVEDYTKIPEIITSILELRSGKNKKEIINSWDGSTSLVVKSGLASLTESIKGKTKEVWRPKTLVNN